MNDREQHEPLVLYLDIDGVITTAGYQRTAGKDRIDPAAVAGLRLWCVSSAL